MIFGKIDYINLLPFYIFLKKYINSSQIKSILEYKKSYPSNINQKFLKRRIDAAFISSIYSQKEKKTNMGIVSYDRVDSVLCILGNYKKDNESSTSNILAKILNIKGKVLIGDKALRYYYSSNNRDFIDLATVWKDKYNLPFVFARLCYNKNEILVKSLSKKFINQKTKIPQYILNKYSKKSDISKKNILKYLENISYKISYKEEKSLKLFFKLSKKYKRN